jgi:parvulin-like peptidyl-prolyl isomerase
MRCRFQFEPAWGEGDSAASRVVMRSAGHIRASFNSECRPVLEVGVGVKDQAFETCDANHDVICMKNPGQAACGPLPVLVGGAVAPRFLRIDGRRNLGKVITQSSLPRMKVVILLFLLTACLGLATTARAEPQLVNGVAAVVNQKVITRLDIENAVPIEAAESLMRLYGRQPELRQQKELELLQDALDQLVERELILHEFETAGLQLPDSIVEEYLRGIIRQRFGDRLNLTRELQAQGRTIASFRNEVREDYIVRAMRQRNVSSSVLVSPHKIEAYYQQNTNLFRVDDQIRLRMIFLGNRPDRPPAMTRRLADEILQRLEAGAAFEEMATIYSDGSQRVEGGDWGWIEPPKLNEDLAAVALTLQPGDLSDVIELTNGCYLMRLEEVRPAHVRPLPDVRDEIEQTLRMLEHQRLQKQWIDRLKSRSFINYFPMVGSM